MEAFGQSRRLADTLNTGGGHHLARDIQIEVNNMLAERSFEGSEHLDLPVAEKLCLGNVGKHSLAQLGVGNAPRQKRGFRMTHPLEPDAQFAAFGYVQPVAKEGKCEKSETKDTRRPNRSLHIAPPQADQCRGVERVMPPRCRNS